MKFKTHSERNGELMFTVFDTEKAMHEAIAKVPKEELFFDRVSVFVEDGKGWKLIACSGWLADLPDKGTIKLREERVLYRLGEVPIRWQLFSDDEALDRSISRTFFAPKKVLDDPFAYGASW